MGRSLHDKFEQSRDIYKVRVVYTDLWTMLIHWSLLALSLNYSDNEYKLPMSVEENIQQ